jgi:hypothetical protein
MDMIDKLPTTRRTGGLMKTPRRGLKASRFMQLTIQYQGRSRQAKKRFTLPFNILLS